MDIEFRIVHSSSKSATAVWGLGFMPHMVYDSYVNSTYSTSAWLLHIFPKMIHVAFINHAHPRSHWGRPGPPTEVLRWTCHRSHLAEEPASCSCSAYGPHGRASCRIELPSKIRQIPYCTIEQKSHLEIRARSLSFSPRSRSATIGSVRASEFPNSEYAWAMTRPRRFKGARGPSSDMEWFIRRCPHQLGRCWSVGAAMLAVLRRLTKYWKRLS